MTRKNEARLKTQDIQKLSDRDFLRFITNRQSFYRDYKLLHGTEEEEVKKRVNTVTYYKNPKSLLKELRLCFDAAIQTDSRQTYHFNLFVIDLIERYYSDAIYYSKKEEIENHHLVSQANDDSHISYEWVLSSRILNSYQRYLLFEYIALGYSVEDLAARRSCTSRTIQNHLKAIAEALHPHG